MAFNKLRLTCLAFTNVADFCSISVLSSSNSCALRWELLERRKCKREIYSKERMKKSGMAGFKRKRN